MRFHPYNRTSQDGHLFLIFILRYNNIFPHISLIHSHFSISIMGIISTNIMYGVYTYYL